MDVQKNNNICDYGCAKRNNICAIKTRLEFLYCKAGFKNKFEKAWSKFLESKPTEQAGQAAKPLQGDNPKEQTRSSNGTRGCQAPIATTPIAEATAKRSAPAPPCDNTAEITQPGQRKIITKSNSKTNSNHNSKPNNKHTSKHNNKHNNKHNSKHKSRPNYSKRNSKHNSKQTLVKVDSKHTP